MWRLRKLIAVGLTLSVGLGSVSPAGADTQSGDAWATVVHRNTAPGSLTWIGSHACDEDADLVRWTENYSNGESPTFLLDESIMADFDSWAVGVPTLFGVLLLADAPPGPLTLVIECIDTTPAPDEIIGMLTIDLVVVVPFGDVPDGAWYTDAVTWAHLSDVTTGTSPTTFSPDEGVTRSQMALFLQRLFAGTFGDEFDGLDAFTDTGHLRDEFRSAIGWLADADITTGVGDNRFDPDGTVTRWQMALFLSRFAEHAGIDVSAAVDPFADTGHLRDEFRQVIGWLSKTGITIGIGGNLFDPEGVVTRAQMVTFLRRLWEYIEDNRRPDAPLPNRIGCPVPATESSEATWP